MDIAQLFSVRGKVALVTGGSRGIGEMIATGLVHNGATVYISSRDQKACATVAARLNAQGPGKCIDIPADLSKTEEVIRLADEIKKRETELHILVNNAGANWGAPIEQYPDSAFDKVLNLNVKSCFSLVKYLLPLLEKAGKQNDPARVINIGSVDGIRVPQLETYAYSSSKAALHHLTQVLAGQLGTRNIAVNTVAPGPFQSKMMAATLKKFEQEIVSTIPLKRIGVPEDMAGVVIFLSSKAGAYVNGACITVDGGSVVRASL